MSNSSDTEGDRHPLGGGGAAIKASGGQLLFRLVAEFKSAAQVAD